MYDRWVMNPRFRRCALALALCLAATGAYACAQTASPTASPSPAPSATPSGPSDPCGSILSTVNRPTFTTGVCTLQTGHFDIENGYTNYVTTGPGGGNDGTYPQSLVRVGTFDPHLDVELGLPSFNRASTGGTITSGWSDLNVGAKYELGYGARWLYGVNTVVTLPTGSKAFSAGNAQFTGNFNWSYAVNSVIGVAGTLGFNAMSAYNAAGSPQSYFAFVPTLEVSAALPGTPNQLFGEYAEFSQAGPNLGGRSYFDFGYERDFGPHVQFDVEYGFSPTLVAGQKQHYVGAGLSFMH